MDDSKAEKIIFLLMVMISFIGCVKVVISMDVNQKEKLHDERCGNKYISKGEKNMIKVIIGCSLFLASICILYAGFIISAIGSSDRTVNTNFVYSIWHVNILWTVVPIVLFVLPCIVTYSGYKEYSYNQVES